MEELSQAVERFKQSRREMPRGGNGAMGGRSVPPPIIYTRTRIVECAEDALHGHRVLSGMEGGLFADSYRLLRTQVLHRLRENGWNVLGVSSPRGQEGKTVTALNLAIAMAMEATQTVLLIDADLKQPRVHDFLGLGEVRGLADYLLDEAPLEDLLVSPALGRLVVLPGGRPIGRSAEALTSPRMAALVEEVKHRYPSRIIVIDLPPLLLRSDVLAFAPSLDALLLVAGEGMTTRSDVEEALALVRGAVPVLGTVLNHSGRSQGALKTLRKSVVV